MLPNLSTASLLLVSTFHNKSPPHEPPVAAHRNVKITGKKGMFEAESESEMDFEGEEEEDQGDSELWSTTVAPLAL